MTQRFNLSDDAAELSEKLSNLSINIWQVGADIQKSSAQVITSNEGIAASNRKTQSALGWLTFVLAMIALTDLLYKTGVLSWIIRQIGLII